MSHSQNPQPSASCGIKKPSCTCLLNSTIFSITRSHWEYIIKNMLPYCSDIPFYNEEVTITLLGNLYSHISQVTAFQGIGILTVKSKIIDLCENISKIVEKVHSAIYPNRSMATIILHEAMASMGYSANLINIDHLIACHYFELNWYINEILIKSVKIIEQKMLLQVRKYIHEIPDIAILTKLITFCPTIDVKLLTNENQQSAIHIICMVGEDDSEFISMFLKNAAPETLKGLINLQRKDDGNTALHLASKNGKINILKCIVEKGADTSLTNFLGQTPLDLATNDNIVYILKKAIVFDSTKDTHLLTTLLKKNILVRETLPPSDDDVDLLSYAIDSLNVTMVEEILKRNKSCVNKKNKFDMSPLVKAIGLDNVDIVRILLQKGADASALDGGMNALHYGVKKGDVQVVDVLLDYIEDVNISSHDAGLTALHFASNNGNVEVVKLLLARGANFEVKNNFQKTPLDLSINRDVSHVLNSISNLFTVVQKRDLDEEKSLTDIFLRVKESENYDVFWKATNNSGNTAIQLMMENKGPVYLWFKKLFLCTPEPPAGS